MHVELFEQQDGIVFSVHAQAHARRSAIVGVHQGALKVSVTAPAERGKANAAILALLADRLGLRRAQLELVSGATARDKRICVRGISRSDLQQRIANALSAQDSAGT